MASSAVLSYTPALHRVASSLSSRSRALRSLLEERAASVATAEGARSAAVGESDRDIRDLAELEASAAESRTRDVEAEIVHCVLEESVQARDESAEIHEAIVEVRPGAGGEESAKFAGELAEMYMRYAHYRGWRGEEISAAGGTGKAVLRLLGEIGLFSRMKCESGVHRVQRVPDTESTGRVHSSTVSVVVLPCEHEASSKMPPIDSNDLRIEAFRAGGAGGQHVNKTESAVRLTHLPTGLSVSCQDQRSQLQNRERAMKLLRIQIQARHTEERMRARSAARRAQLGSVAGERSDRIRTYNFLQGRVTDHRVKGLSIHGPVDRFLSGGEQLDHITEALLAEERKIMLQELLRSAERDG